MLSNSARRRPELAQSDIIQNVSKELIRAKRLDEEERFYRESVAGATQVGQISAHSAWLQSGATPIA